VSKKEKVRDKFYSTDDPKNDVDFIEISTATSEQLDQLVQKYSKLQAPPIDDDIDNEVVQQKNHRRKERLVRKIFKAASMVLTDIQFQIFILRTVCAAKEKEIAAQLSVNQSYVSNVLRASNQKIRIALRLKDANLEKDK